MPGSVVVEFGFEPNDTITESFAPSSLTTLPEGGVDEEGEIEAEVVSVGNCPFQPAILNGWLSQNLPSPAR